MQVHKDVIDKVPNSLPNRSDIEIEIYGMEGIPADDLKEHDKLKGKAGGPPRSGSPSSGEDEPSPKKVKTDGLPNGPAVQAAPVQMSMMRPAMPPGMMGGLGPPGMFAPPGMHHMMGAMGHPFLPPG